MTLPLLFQNVGYMFIRAGLLYALCLEFESHPMIDQEWIRPRRKLLVTCEVLLVLTRPLALTRGIT